MTFMIGERVQSRRVNTLVGTVIGYGAIQWPHSNVIGETNVDDDMYPVYLVQINPQGSSSLGQAVVVMRADQVRPAQ
jgi:hypothetical protein